MKLFSLALLSLLPALAFGARELGHESGGRLAANTVYIRFTSEKAKPAVQSLVKLEADAGQVLETRTKDDEDILCVRLKNSRLRFTIALDRVVRLLHAEKEVGWQVGVGHCSYIPEGNYTGQDTAYVTDTRPEAKRPSLVCESSDELPDAYHYHLELFETLDSTHEPRIAYTLTQSSRSARFRPLSGEVQTSALGFVEGALSFQYGFDGERVTVLPTAQPKDGGTLYTGVVTRDGSDSIRLTCVSGRPQGPIR